MGNEQGNNKLTRGALERRILIAADSIHWDSSKGCVDGEAVEEFLAGWYELLRYFELEDDAMIGVEVVREYLQWVRSFERIMNDSSISPGCRQYADDTYTDLTYLMDEIIVAVTRRLHPEGRSRNANPPL